MRRVEDIVAKTFCHSVFKSLFFNRNDPDQAACTGLVGVLLLAAKSSVFFCCMDEFIFSDSIHVYFSSMSEFILPGSMYISVSCLNSSFLALCIFQWHVLIHPSWLFFCCMAELIFPDYVYFCFTGALLKAALIKQHLHPPNLDLVFSVIEPPDLNQMFVKKKARFNKRTSSAHWDTPILQPGLLGRS